MDSVVLDEYRTLILSAEARLLGMAESAAERPRIPGKWSPKEIIGHLIDSASNNHRRFVLAQFTDDLLFDGYEQDAWVMVQQYQQEEWRQLVTLWKTFNLHLLHAVSRFPEESLTKERKNHNLHLRAFHPAPEDRPATLEYFIRDYFDHLKHHLAQIFTPETELKDRS